MQKTIQLQPRDLVLLERVKTDGAHSIRALAELYFEGKIHAARKRIRKLEIAGLLFKMQVSDRVGFIPVDPGKEFSDWRGGYSQHDFEVKETVAALVSFCRALPNCEIQDISFNARLTQWFQSTDPDASIRLSFEERHEELLFIEHDRGTEPLRTILGKCLRYQQLLKVSGELLPFRVLFVCKSSQRAENISTLLQNHTSIRTLVMCAAFEDVKERPGRQIWITPSQKTEKQELFPSALTNSSPPTC